MESMPDGAEASSSRLCSSSFLPALHSGNVWHGEQKASRSLRQASAFQAVHQLGGHSLHGVRCGVVRGQALSRHWGRQGDSSFHCGVHPVLTWLLLVLRRCSADQYMEGGWWAGVEGLYFLPCTARDRSAGHRAAEVSSSSLCVSAPGQHLKRTRLRPEQA